MIIYKYDLMKKIFLTDWKYGVKILYLSITICFLFITYYNLNSGIVMSPDSETFSEWADILIKLDFNLYKYFNQNTFVNQNYLYLIPVLLISLFKLFFHSNWQLLFVSLNLLAVFFSLIIFSKILLLLKIRALVISIGILILCISSDLLLWPRYVLTDTIFSFLIILIIYLITISIINEKINYFLITLILVLLFLTRPTSLPYIMSIVLFISLLKIQKNFNPKKILIFFISLLVLTPFILAILFDLIKIYLIDNPQASLIIEWVETGQVIHDRPETWVKAPSSFNDLVILYFKRIIFFFVPYVDSFSFFHSFIDTIQAFLVISATIIWFFLGEKLNSINKVITLILFITLCVSAFHSFTIIDYDWRYRFPIILPIMIIVPISIELILRKKNI